jgi:hypothetical protein
MRKILIILMVIVATISTAQIRSLFLEKYKLKGKYGPCYQCQEPKKYYIYNLPDTIDQRERANKYGCNPIRTVKKCGSNGQIILNKNH